MPSIQGTAAEALISNNGMQDSMLAMMKIHKTSKNPIMADQETFDGSSEPIIYMSENRIPVMMDAQNMLIYVIFGALLLTLLFLLPSVRKTKLATLISLLAILISGLAIFAGLSGSNWLVGGIWVANVQYSGSRSSIETFTGFIDINIGTSWTNVTLSGIITKNDQETTTSYNEEQVYFNERFNWDTPERMLADHRLALQRGLPYPILTVSEFLSQDSDGFNWSRQFRTAGYYTSISLYFALASWCLTAVVLCAIPRYLTHMLQITSGLLLISAWLYTILIGSSPIEFNGLRIGGIPVEFRFGFNYLMCIIGGMSGLFASIILLTIQLYKPQDKLTALDSDDHIQDLKTIYSLQTTKELAKGKLQEVVIPIGNN